MAKFRQLAARVHRCLVTRDDARHESDVANVAGHSAWRRCGPATAADRAPCRSHRVSVTMSACGLDGIGQGASPLFCETFRTLDCLRTSLGSDTASVSNEPNRYHTAATWDYTTRDIRHDVGSSFLQVARLLNYVAYLTKWQSTALSCILIFFDDN